MALRPAELLKQTAPDTRPVIALSEGHDPRIIAGALAAEGLADLLLIGDRDAIAPALAAAGGAETAHLSIQDPTISDLTPELADLFHNLRKHKGVDEDAAQKAACDPLTHAALLVRAGHADGTLGGAVHTTGDVVRVAFQVIGTAPGTRTVSSVMLLYPPQPEGRALAFGDCGLIIDPDAEQLASIAASSAATFRAFVPEDPRVAMLSFSTHGSARHPNVTKVAEATAQLRAAHPGLIADGEIQFDAAIVPEVCAAKAPGSPLQGQANIFVFPSLEAGNIGYKIAQRLGGYTAIGPVLQGLAKPANDLSRGCVAEDVTEMIAVTALQALSPPTG